VSEAEPTEIPPALACAVRSDPLPARSRWLAALPRRVREIAAAWRLELGEPYLPGGQCAWVAPARDRAGTELVLKVGWRHYEAEGEADGLRLWDGDGAVRCLAGEVTVDTSALLLERCDPGVPLGRALAEPEQDAVIAASLRRLWERQPPPGHPFASLQEMCGCWAGESAGETDPGLVHEGIAALRELPRTADRSVLLCTDLHAGNVLASEREPWLAIDPKPFVGDPAYDTVQHMLNCRRRLAEDPVGLADRMAVLTGAEPARVRLWLFARCAQESARDPALREPARRLAP
jgi:streptomycin 6-kinase